MAFDPAADAQRLYKAMKGVGTDEKVLIEVIGNRNNMQLQQIRAAFQQNHGKDLIKELKSETSGNFQDLLAALVVTPAEYDAKCCFKAMKGIGTNEDTLIETLTQRSNEEIAAINEAYIRLYEKKLEKDLKGDLSGDFEKLMVGLSEGRRILPPQPDPETVKNEIEKLYQAGEKKSGTNEKVFLEIFTKYDNRYLQMLSMEYGQAKGKTLNKVVEKEFSGNLRKAMLAMLTPHDEYYAHLLHEAVKGAGTDDKRLIRIVTSRRAYLPGINVAFLKFFEKRLDHRIKNDVSGDYGKLLTLVASHA